MIDSVDVLNLAALCCVCWDARLADVVCSCAPFQDILLLDVVVMDVPWSAALLQNNKSKNALVTKESGDVTRRQGQVTAILLRKMVPTLVFSVSHQRVCKRNSN